MQLIQILLLVEVAPYWNVNLVISIFSGQVLLVEVAPYWNVNATSGNIYHYKQWVEVAPYWNVNEGFTDDDKKRYG